MKRIRMSKRRSWHLEHHKGTRRRRLTFEQMEGREMLAGVLVSNHLDVANGDTSSIAAIIANPGDDGISLREAIVSANATPGYDTIAFDTSLAGKTIRLGGTELVITDSLTIDMIGLAGGITIDAQQQSRILRIDNGIFDDYFGV